METETPSPYLKSLIDTLADYKHLLMLLEQRESQLDRCRDDLNPWEYNEALITIAKNKAEINVTKDVIREKEAYFDKYAMDFDERRKKMEAGFENVVNKAKTLAQSDQVIKSMLDKVKWEALVDIEVKVHLYENLLNLVE